MKKFEKKDYLNLLIIAIILIIYYFVITKSFGLLYGSTVDWDCQHFAIPDYFRKLFYKTGNLFPNFAFNLGNGQNIFYMSYYGLLSPIILLSYLFPFIEMVDYIQLVSILEVFISAVLIYKWLYNKFDRKLSFFCSLLFVTTIPILFHSHRHIMFTNYMPFLILGLMGVDKYFEQNRKSLLIISIFLLIMTSYFFSVSAIVMIVLYGIFKFIQKYEKVTFKLFLTEGVKFAFPILMGVLMSMLLILPTFYVIFQGRSSSNVSIDFLNLLKPNFDLNKNFYSSYTAGLTSLSFISLILNILKKDKAYRFLSLSLGIMFMFPIFAYILNGTMYVDNKVFITSVPIVILLLTNFLNYYKNKKVTSKHLIIICMVALVFFILNRNKEIVELFSLDFLGIILLLFLGTKKNREKALFVAVVLTSVISLSTSIFVDKLYSKELYQKTLVTTHEKEYSQIYKQDESIYRISNQNYLLQNINYIPNINYYMGSIYSSTSNPYYKDFYYNNSKNEITQRSYGKITSSMNIFYNLYNANKYLIPDKYVPVGYTKIANTNIYENKNVLPIIYASNNLMSKEMYDNLSFPYNMEALLNYIIVDEKVETEYQSNLKKFEGQIEIFQKDEKIEIKKNVIGDTQKYSLTTTKSSNMELKVSGLNQKDILLIKFKLENNGKCPNGDLAITINGIKNVLTCKTWKYHNKNEIFHYVISSNELIDTLDIGLSKGNFEISDLELYTINYENIANIKNNIDEFVFDKEKTSGDVIKGTINIKNDGYLYMSIPYDPGFNIYLNNEKVSYERVDNDFIGVKVKKGTYDVEVVYKAPLLKDGLVLSSCGILIFIIIWVSENKKIKKVLLNKKN